MTSDTTTTGSSLKLTIRLSSSARFDIGSCGTITPSSTIQHVKTIISTCEESGNCAVERQRLIYKGRILSDNSRTLADYGIGANSADGIIIYLVKGSAANANAATGGGGATATNATATAPPAPAAAPTPANNPFANFGTNTANNNPMANLMNSMGGMGGGGMPDMATFQREMMNNPQMMQEMMNNPMVQSIMNNPDFMRSMMENNPQMRQVLDSNPELRHALEDPELMRRSMEMMRDPSAMQNMMRNQDLAMSQIENMPGGYNALRRMYEDVQEPMMDAMAGGSTSSSNANSNSGTTSGNGSAGATNQAMPNPWGAPAASSSTAGTNTAGSNAANPFASFMGGMGGMGGTPNAAGGASNPWANPMMGNNQPNLDATLQMLENPMMNQMMQNMLNNPEQMRMMMDANPMMRQLREQNPQMAAMLDNPDTMRAMLDPNNIRAMAQMQQAMNQLTGSFPGMGLGSNAPSATGTAAPPAGGLDFSSLLGGASASSGASGAGAANPLFPFMMPPAGGMGGAQTASQPAPGQRFRVQLQNLQDMGFTDRSANIQALTTSHGNVNRAIEILLESPPDMGSSSDAAAATETSADTSESNQAADSGDSEPKGTTEKKND